MLAGADTARVVQFSDTHISHREGVPPSLMGLLDRLDDDPPDLLVVTGDVVLEDPDDAADREFAHAVLTGAPCPVLAIPGNHDIGFYGEDDERQRRIDAFSERWGSDRFAVDVAGWRLVGANAYLLGDAEHNAWLRDAVTSGSPTTVFIHQPQTGGEPCDGWETPEWARVAFDSAIDGGDVRLIVSGHRHRSIRRGRTVWAPSTTLVGDTIDDGTDPSRGAVDYTFRRSGEVDVRFVPA
jgi:alkaline phosphatase D